MNDRSEKIISLANELLLSKTGANFMNDRTTLTAPQKRASPLKAFFLATLLTAFGSALTTHAIDQIRRPLTRYERVELDALVYYASILNAQKEEELRQTLLNNLARSNMDDLTFADFKNARDHLLSQLR